MANTLKNLLHTQLSTDSAQIQILSTDSSEVVTIADNQALLNSLIFGG